MECSELSRSKENQLLGYLVKSRGPEFVFEANDEIFMFFKACNGRLIGRPGALVHRGAVPGGT